MIYFEGTAIIMKWVRYCFCHELSLTLLFVMFRWKVTFVCILCGRLKRMFVLYSFLFCLLYVCLCLARLVCFLIFYFSSTMHSVQKQLYNIWFLVYINHRTCKYSEMWVYALLHHMARNILTFPSMRVHQLCINHRHGWHMWIKQTHRFPQAKPSAQQPPKRQSRQRAGMSEQQRKEVIPLRAPVSPRLTSPHPLIHTLA